MLNININIILISILNWFLLFLIMLYEKSFLDNKNCMNLDYKSRIICEQLFDLLY